MVDPIKPAYDKVADVTSTMTGPEAVASLNELQGSKSVMVCGNARLAASIGLAVTVTDPSGPTQNGPRNAPSV